MCVTDRSVMCYKMIFQVETICSTFADILMERQWIYKEERYSSEVTLEMSYSDFFYKGLALAAVPLDPL